MGGQGDQPAGKKPSLIEKLTHPGRHTGSDVEGDAARGDSIDAETEPGRRSTDERDKVVYYSSNLFNSAMMVDATRAGRDDPAPDEDEEERL